MCKLINEVPNVWESRIEVWIQWQQQKSNLSSATIQQETNFTFLPSNGGSEKKKSCVRIVFVVVFLIPSTSKTMNEQCRWVISEDFNIFILMCAFRVCISDFGNLIVFVDVVVDVVVVVGEYWTHNNSESFPIFLVLFVGLQTGLQSSTSAWLEHSRNSNFSHMNSKEKRNIILCVCVTEKYDLNDYTAKQMNPL